MADHKKLPEDRQAITRKFSIPYTLENPDGTKVSVKLKLYITAGLYPDGTLGEIFVRADKAGSFMAGALDAFAMSMSIGLQHGVPLAMFVSKLRHTKFEPNGFIGDKEFTSCSSAFDLIAAWLEARFLNGNGKHNSNNPQAL